MSLLKIFLLTAVTMVAFAGNSVLCRQALAESGVDPASFTTIRLVAGAGMLWLLVRLRGGWWGGLGLGLGSWWSGFALFGYAACFSFAYVSLPAAVGALILFGAVQATMIGHGVWSGERLRGRQLLGLGLAAVGLAVLLWPGLSAPPLVGSLLMFASGVAWGVYSLRGRGAGDPTEVTAGNFIRSIPFAAVLSVAMLGSADFESPGIWAAIVSGALTSGLGYALWYQVLPSLKATSAASVQLSVPVITAFGGVFFLGELMTLRLALASVAILGGIALVIVETRKK